MRGFYRAWPSLKFARHRLAKLAISRNIHYIGTFFNNCVGRGTLYFVVVRVPRLLSVKRPEARSFYEAEAVRLGWSVRQLDGKSAANFMTQDTFAE
jgi:hypothetical protein